MLLILLPPDSSMYEVVNKHWSRGNLKADTFTPHHGLKWKTHDETRKELNISGRSRHADWSHLRDAVAKYPAREADWPRSESGTNKPTGIMTCHRPRSSHTRDDRPPDVGSSRGTTGRVYILGVCDMRLDLCLIVCQNKKTGFLTWWEYQCQQCNVSK